MTGTSENLTGKPRFRRGWHLSISLLLLSIIVLGVMLAVSTDFDVGQLQDMFSRLSLALVTGLLTLSSINFALRALRWHWYTRRLGLAVSMSDSFSYYLAGFSMGVTPGRMGELVRLWMMRRGHGISYHRALPLLIADRVNDLLVIVVLTLCAGLIVDSSSLGYVLFALGLMVAAYMLLRHPNILISLIDYAYGLVRRWRRLFAAARRTLRTGREMFSAANAALASVFSMLAWFAECLAFYLLLSALDAGVSIESATFIYAFATLVGALSFLPGGLGGFEAVAVILLGARGVDIGTAVFATTVIRLTTLWFSVALGSFMLSHVLINIRAEHAKSG